MTAGLLPPAPRERLVLPHLDQADVYRSAFAGLRVHTDEIIGVKNPDRRMACERDLLLFLLTYFGHLFWDFSPAHIEIVRNLQAAILSGVVDPFRFAIAAPRGFGKSSLGIGIVLWASLYRHRRFCLFLRANQPDAEKMLASFKNEIQTNPLIREDFPEIVDALNAFNFDARSAPTDYPWSTSRVRLANGVWIQARGIDSSVAGIMELFVRPDFIWTDDCETLGHVDSTAESKTLEKRLHLEVMKLHDINRPAVYAWINTIRGVDCLTDRLVDPMQEPAWRKYRYSAIRVFPAHEEMWEQFMALCREGARYQESDAEREQIPIGIDPAEFAQKLPGHRAALRLFHQHKEKMYAGAELLDSIRLPLERVYHDRAVEGEDIFWCDIQNTPRKKGRAEIRALDQAVLIKRCMREYPQGVVPPWANLLLLTADIGLHRIHWECAAWDTRTDVSIVIDAGIETTEVDTGGAWTMAGDGSDRRKSMVEVAVVGALARIHARAVEGWPKHGEVLLPYCAADAGGTAEEVAWLRAVVEFVHQRPRWIALKGQPNWRDSLGRRSENLNFFHDEDRGFTMFNADFYKHELYRAYARDVIPQKRDGVRGKVLQIEQPHTHGARFLSAVTTENNWEQYCRHQTAEEYREEHLEDKFVQNDTRRGWVKRSKDNHWFDTGSMNMALRDILRHRPRPTARRQLQTSVNAEAQIPPELG